MNGILEKLGKCNFPCDRLPTTKECIRAIEYPEQTEQWIKDYLEQSPDYEKLLRKTLELRGL